MKVLLASVLVLGVLLQHSLTEAKEISIYEIIKEAENTTLPKDLILHANTTRQERTLLYKIIKLIKKVHLYKSLWLAAIYKMKQQLPVTTSTKPLPPPITTTTTKSGGHENMETTTAAVTSPPTTTAPPTNSTPIHCKKDNDLIIAIDSSGSVGAAFPVVLDFASRLSVAWKAHPGNRIEVIVFSDRVQILFNLVESTTMTASEIKDKILGAEFQNGGTEIYLALDAATSDFKRYNRSSSISGMGPDRNLVVLTDGYSSLTQTVQAAHRFYQIPGAMGFSVAIGTYINEAELLAIANGNTKHVLNANDFQGLLEVLRPLSSIVCNDIQML